MRVCELCGAEIGPKKRKDTHFCSSKCRWIAHFLRKLGREKVNLYLDSVEEA